jgi:endonuclease YncB( thermonuclease family)
MNNRLTFFGIIFLIAICIFSCERKSGRRNIETSSAGTCICRNYPCDYCVKVVGITDGDTFTGLTNKNEQIKYRIYGIDAPERKQAYGTKSKEHLSELIFGKTVGIKVESTDRWGRLIVWVFTPDRKDVGAEMLKAGMAWHFKRYDNSELYDKLENEAKMKRIGLWADGKSVAPWEYRR